MYDNISTYRVIKQRKKSNAPECHHPVEKIEQLKRFQHLVRGNILEVFAGKGNLTQWYRLQGDVTALDKLTTGNSFDVIHALRAERKTYQFIDVDGYSGPEKLLPVIMELTAEQAAIVLTVPYGNAPIDKVREEYYLSWWHNYRVTPGDIVGVVTNLALQQHKFAQFVDMKRFEGIYRYIFRIWNVKVTEVYGRYRRCYTKRGEDA